MVLPGRSVCWLLKVVVSGSECLKIESAVFGGFEYWVLVVLDQGVVVL